MKPDDNREEALLRDAVRLAAGPEREAFLVHACAGDEQLRRRLDARLQAHEGPTAPLASPAPLPTGAAVRVVAAVAEVQGQMIGRYKLLEKIGEGGFGVVYAAEQTEPVRRRVALKIIKLGMDTRAVVARFEAERQALAMMDHPNIAKIFDAGMTEGILQESEGRARHSVRAFPGPSEGGAQRSDAPHPPPPMLGAGRPYFVMELVRGIPITDYCDQNHLGTKERLDLFIQVCHAIQHAHQKGIIHRDIKPSNILVAMHDGAPVPKVIDFGIAKAIEGRMTDATVYTQLHQFMGTPAYMSPEQAERSGLDIDTRSDIYSLGVLLYEFLTGKTPFDAEQLMAAGIDAMRRTIREQEPARPSTRLAMLREEELTTTAKRRSSDAPRLIHVLKGDLDWIVMKCLEKDRTRRYETASGLAADLKRHLGNEPVMARPPSAAYRFQKAWRRHKLAFTAAAVVAFALIAGISVSSWQAIEANRAKAAEKKQRLAAQTERDKAQAEQKEAERAQQAEQQARLRADAEKAEANHLLYIANMNLAQQAWDQNNIGRLRQLLDETATNTERGFEWYYWQRLAHLEVKTLRGHTGGILSVAFSPDGQRIVTGSFDKTAKVWDVASGRELVILHGHHRSVMAVAFSPNGRWIVTGSEDQTARVWDAASGKELFTLKGHSSGIDAVAFSPDGQRIITGSEDQTAKVWESANGREVLTIKAHGSQINSVAFSPDGLRIVTGGRDGTATVWESSSGREGLTIQGHGSQINSVAFSPDGTRILTGTGDSWNLGSGDHSATIWDSISGHELLQLNGHSSAVRAATFSPDGQRILTGSWDHTAKVWEAASGKELFTLKGQSSAINSVAFSPDGLRIATGSGDWMSTADHTTKLWDAAGGKEVLALRGDSSRINSVAFSPDGQRIVSGDDETMAKVWDAATGKEGISLRGHSRRIFSVAFSPNGQRIVTGCFDKTAKVWDATSGRNLLTLRGHHDSVWSAAFSPNGLRIVTGSIDNTAKVWDAISGTELLTLKGHIGGVFSVAFTPDGQRIVTGSGDGTAKVWESGTGRVLVTLKGHKSVIVSMAISPDGQHIVTGSCDGTAKVWDATTGGDLLTLSGHVDQVWAVGFSPDGHRIVTGSLDGTAKVWEATEGKELLTLKGHLAAIHSVAFSPDGQRIATGSWDKTAMVWKAASGQEVEAWRAEERAADQHFADVERERSVEEEREQIARAGDEGTIKRWLILAPIALAPGQSGAEGLDLEQIKGESSLRPKAGEVISFGNGEVKWQEPARKDYVIDFNLIAEQSTNQRVAYAVCYLRSEAAQAGLQILAGSEHEAKIYLNGQEIYKAPTPHGSVEVQDTVSGIALNAGLNALVFKVVNEGGDWMGSIRFTDAQGNPVKGIKVTLDPDEK